LAKVNPNVLGGVIIDFGDKTIDLRVSSRVTKFNSALQRKYLIVFHVIKPDSHLQSPYEAEKVDSWSGRFALREDSVDKIVGK
jgi:hypothetical protein